LGGSGATGVITLPLPTVNATSVTTIGDSAIILPVLTVLASGMPGNNAGVITLPLLTVLAHAGATGVITLPILTVLGGSGATGVITLPVLTVEATGSVIGNNSTINLPILSVNAGSGVILVTGDITLPIFTVSGTDKLPADITLTLSRLTVSAQAQQGSVENISLTMPMLTLRAYSGHVVRLTLPSFSLNAVGQSGIRGLYDRDLPRLQVLGYGTLHQHGNVNVRIPLFSLQTNLINGIISISTDIVLPVLTTNLHGFRGENGNVSIVFPMIETATEVALNPNATAGLSLFALKLDAYADVYINRII
jgi:hypothetical protein